MSALGDHGPAGRPAGHANANLTAGWLRRGCPAFVGVRERERETDPKVRDLARSPEDTCVRVKTYLSTKSIL